MNIYTEKTIKEIIRDVNNKKQEFLGVKLPASLYKPPVFEYTVNGDGLEIEILLDEFEKSGLIVTLNRKVVVQDNIIKLIVDCTKYFYEKEDKDAHFEDTISPDYKKRFINYDDDYLSNHRKEDNMCKCNQPKFCKPNRHDNNLEDDIIKISTDDLIMEILSEVRSQIVQSTTIEELSYDNTFKGKKYDYNKIYVALNKFAYSISITIDDSDPLSQTTKISFKYMSI